MPTKTTYPEQPRHVSLFAGIGGFELAFARAGFRTILASEVEPLCQRLLARHFGDLDQVGDMLSVQKLPPCDVLTAGFPCQDFSQAGRTHGLNGRVGPLLQHLFRLLNSKRNRPTWIVLENVPNIVHLEHGAAVRYITDNLSSRGYRWAYRMLDAADFGVPQRRKRWILIASNHYDPAGRLFDWTRNRAEETGARAVGFYWTEGNKGLGWAPNLVPPLKGGSSFSIPSAPAVWLRASRSLGTPSIRDAERLQGFPEDWTFAPDEHDRKRWRLVGNAVNVSMVEWIAKMLLADRDVPAPSSIKGDLSARVPTAAYFDGNSVYVPTAQKAREVCDYEDIVSFLSHPLKPLSLRAASGFLSRARRSSLRFAPDFLADVAFHVRTVSTTG